MLAAVLRPSSRPRPCKILRRDTDRFQQGCRGKRRWRDRVPAPVVRMVRPVSPSQSGFWAVRPGLRYLACAAASCGGPGRAPWPEPPVTGGSCAPGRRGTSCEGAPALAPASQGRHGSGCPQYHGPAANGVEPGPERLPFHPTPPHQPLVMISLRCGDPGRIGQAPARGISFLVNPTREASWCRLPPPQPSPQGGGCSAELAARTEISPKH